MKSQRLTLVEWLVIASIVLIIGAILFPVADRLAGETYTDYGTVVDRSFSPASTSYGYGKETTTYHTAARYVVLVNCDNHGIIDFKTSLSNYGRMEKNSRVKVWFKKGRFTGSFYPQSVSPD